MKTSVSSPAPNDAQSASQLITQKIAELGDWRGETLARMRQLIAKADPDVTEEWKWMVRRCFRTMALSVPAKPIKML